MIRRRGNAHGTVVPTQGDDPDVDLAVLAESAMQPQSLEAVQSRIGRTMHAAATTPNAPRVLGEITLMAHQRTAVVRLLDLLSRHGGALLADDVGLGKTFVALGVARNYTTCHVIAPAALRPMWTEAVRRAASTGVSVHSLHAFSVAPPPCHAANRGTARELLVIDEAHHLRNANTARYRAVAAMAAHRDVLLISATPHHNRADDLANMFALFAGTRGDLLTPDVVASLTIRREHLASGAPRPVVRQHDAMKIPYDAATLTALMALPAPLPAHDGAVAGALIRIGLLRAWCSSDAALSLTIRKRLLRGEALRSALECGRHPTSAELRTWLVGEHEVQLAFPELMATQAVAPEPLLDVLSTHLAALSALLAHHQDTARGDAERRVHLRRVLDSHVGVPVVAFSQFAGTVRALFRALGDIAGVGALSAGGGQIASGRISRADTLARFAPVSQGKPPPPAHQAIRLLLATDLLAEGVNLQDAGVVVHLDLPWTDALLTQRVGRAVRTGALHREVHVYRFAIPADVECALLLLERLATKRALSACFVGGSGATPGPAQLTTIVDETLEQWSMLPPVDGAADTRTSICIVRTECGACTWLALVSVEGAPQLVAHTGAGPSSSVSAVSHAMLQIGEAQATAWPAGSGTQHIARIYAELQQWCDAQEIQRHAGPSGISTSASRIRLTSHIHELVASAAAARRPQLAVLAHRALEVVASVRGIAAERALDVWLGLRERRSGAEWLATWAEVDVLSGAGPPVQPRSPASSGVLEILALIVVEAPAGLHVPLATTG